MEHTFWTDKLSKFLYENHPDLIFKLKETDELDDFINVRAEATSTEFELLSTQGVHQDCAFETVIANLQEGLKFSRFNMVESILQEHFIDTYDKFKDKNKRMAFLVQLVLQCEEVFKKYDCSDNFAYDDHFDAEIIGTIEEILEHKTIDL